jgi:hypothetical protein
VLELNSTAALNINSMGTLDIGTGTFRTSGDLSNSGSFTATESGGDIGTVIFDGNGATGGLTQDLSGDFNTGNSFQEVVVGDSAQVDPENTNFTVRGPFTVQNDGSRSGGGIWGSGTGESATVQYEGFDFSVNGDGEFFSSEISFNNPSADAGSDPLFASGEVFSRVLITGGGTFVQVNESFTANDRLTVASGDSLDLESPGTLTVNDDFENNGAFTPGSQTVAFEGQTDTGGGDPGAQDCSGVETSDGDCEQDLLGTGEFDLGPIDVDLDDTRVVLSQGNQAPVKPRIQTLTIDPGSDNSNVQFVLDDSDLDIESNLINNGSFRAGNKLVSFIGGTSLLRSPRTLDFARVRISSASTPAVTLDTTNFTVDTLDVENGKLLVDSKDTLRVQGKLRLDGGDGDDGNDGLVSVEIDNANGGRGVLTDKAVLEYVDNNGSTGIDGTVQGTLVKQRSLEGGAQWRYMASPLGTSGETDTFEALFEQGLNTQDLWTQGFTGSDAPNADPSTSNVLFYDETADGLANQNDEGWTSISAASDNMMSGKGYPIFVFTDNDFFTSGQQGGFPKTIDADVEPASKLSYDYTQSDGSAVSGGGPGLDVTDNQPDDSSVSEDEGWNLLGNPYLARVDWDDFNRNNVDDVVWVWDPVNEVYATWSTSMQSGAGTSQTLDGGIIAPLQGFFVKANAFSSLNLEIPDITTVQSDTTGDVFLKSAPSAARPLAESSSSLPPLVGFDVELGSLKRGTSVGFVEGASFQKDSKGDGYQFGFGDTGPQLALFTLLDNGNALTLNALPRDLPEEDEVVVPMDAKVDGCRADDTAFEGEATLTWPKLRNVPAGWSLELVDTRTNERINLTGGTRSQYTFTIESEMSDSECASKRVRPNASSRTTPSPAQPSVLNTTSATNAKDTSSTPDARFELIVESTAVLPVELTSVNGRVDDQDAILTWETASETNNAGFQVQQKRDGSFSDLEGAFVEGAGTTEESQSYRFRVEDLDAGSHTFRLKQVDTDGSSTFSDPIDVNVGLAGDYNFTTYPNPVSTRATVEFAVKEKEEVTIALYNTLGQRVKTIYRDTPPAEQTRQIALDTDGLSSGLYILRLQSEGVSATQRITVVK